MKEIRPVLLGPRLDVAGNYLTGLKVCFQYYICVLLTDYG